VILQAEEKRAAEEPDVFLVEKGTDILFAGL
jgi:hypothetical protein